MAVGYIPKKDNSGRAVNRQSVTEAGWSYHAIFFELETSTIGSLYSKDMNGSNHPFSIQFLKSNGQGGYAACSDQNDCNANCIKTLVIYAPTHDYEIISGHIHQIEKPLNNLRLSVYGGAYDLGKDYCVQFVSNLNLKFVGADEAMETDGRASKLVAYSTAGVPVPTNKLAFEIDHDAGIAHDIMIGLEIFRP